MKKLLRIGACSLSSNAYLSMKSKGLAHLKQTAYGPISRRAEICQGLSVSGNLVVRWGQRGSDRAEASQGAGD